MPDYRLGIEVEASDFDALQKTIDGASGSVGGFNTAALGAAGVLLGLGAAAVGVGAHFTGLAMDIDEAGDRARTQLGLSAEEAERFEGTMQGIFNNNFGEDFDDIGASLVAVNQQFERLGGPETQEQLQQVTERALAMRDAFDLEVNESTGAAITLMENFGLTSEQAFGFLTTGIQRGLNSSDDFLDTIGEYSVQFSDIGFRAEEFFSILETGNAGGVLGTDKIADAVKEFSIIMKENSGETHRAFEALGMDLDQINGFIAGGDEEFSEYFKNVIKGLQEVEDPIERNRLGTELFGTQWEDLTETVILGVSDQKTSLEELEKGTESLDEQYDNVRAMWEQNSRLITSALLPIGETITELAEEAMPTVTDFITVTLVPKMQEWISVGVTGLTGPSGLITAIQASGASQSWQPLLQSISDSHEKIATLVSTGETIIEWATRIRDAMRIYISDPLLDIENRIRNLLGKDPVVPLDLQEFEPEPEAPRTLFTNPQTGTTRTVTGLEPSSPHAQTVLDIIANWVGPLLDQTFDQIIREQTGFAPVFAQSASVRGGPTINVYLNGNSAPAILRNNVEQGVMAAARAAGMAI